VLTNEFGSVGEYLSLTKRPAEPAATANMALNKVFAARVILSLLGV
jgi:hypothetical protein